jgi:hypothetical protein
VKIRQIKIAESRRCRYRRVAFLSGIKGKPTITRRYYSLIVGEFLAEAAPDISRGALVASSIGVIAMAAATLATSDDNNR